MRLPIIAGNWKMNTTVAEARELVLAMKDGLHNAEGVEKVLCPPFVSLTTVGELIEKTAIKLGAQNMFYEEKGAFTGEISPLMLATFCQYVILGHSERRQYFGETDEIVNKKVRAALKAGLRPIVCVGERLDENEAGRTAEVVARQVKGAFVDVPSLENVVVAYEPIWAIGTGRAATADQANDTIGLIRETLASLFGTAAASATRIQYGGSVTPANIEELMGMSEIDGGLVGGASLKAADFVELVRKAAIVKKGR